MVVHASMEEIVDLISIRNHVKLSELSPSSQEYIKKWYASHPEARTSLDFLKVHYPPEERPDYITLEADTREATYAARFIYLLGDDTECCEVEVFTGWKLKGRRY